MSQKETVLERRMLQDRRVGREPRTDVLDTVTRVLQADTRPLDAEEILARLSRAHVDDLSYLSARRVGRKFASARKALLAVLDDLARLGRVEYVEVPVSRPSGGGRVRGSGVKGGWRVLDN